MVGLINYGMGNLLSVYNGLKMVGADITICREPEQLDQVDKIVLPGVGAFGDCISNLRLKGFNEALNYNVNQKLKPILGICLGMQVMAQRGFEGGEFKGLGWFDADVVRLSPNNPSFRVPHVGWNEVTYKQGSPLFLDLPKSVDLYFVHSYFMKCDNLDVVDSTCEHGQQIIASVRKNNILATQFHPEKSQDYGLRILENFLKWKP